MSSPAQNRFNRLYDELWSDLRGYLRRRCTTDADADDLLAETFTIVWRRIADVPAGHDSRPWIFGIARNLIREYYRGRDRRRQITDRLLSELVTRPAAESGPRKELDDLAVTIQALGLLNEADRELIQLVAWEGLSHADCGVILQCSTNAVGIRLHRARARLQEKIGEMTGEST